MQQETKMKHLANKFEDVVDLAHWSTNCEYPTPFTLFLDLIGWSEEAYGEMLIKDLSKVGLGYVELDYLADALKQYALQPQDCLQVVEWLVYEDPTFQRVLDGVA